MYRGTVQVFLPIYKKKYMYIYLIIPVLISDFLIFTYTGG